MGYKKWTKKKYLLDKYDSTEISTDTNETKTVVTTTETTATTTTTDR